jgi:hypothetical protein
MAQLIPTFLIRQQIDRAKVAKDGYEALMNGEAHAISEIENKIHLASDKAK